MAFTLPADLPEDWVDDIGMIEDADFLNDVGDMANALKAAMLVLVNGSASATVSTQESTTSTTYTDLATTTDQVTVTVGASGKAIIILSADMSGNNTSARARMGFAMSGSNTAAASDTFAAAQRIIATSVQYFGTTTKIMLLTGLSAGSTTFKAKYRIDLGSGFFQDRSIIVIPFP